MSTTRKIEISVVEVGTKDNKTHLARVPIGGITDSKSGRYHGTDGVSSGAVGDMIHEFNTGPANRKFEIHWKPPGGKETLFNNLKSKSKSIFLDITIYWIVRDDLTVQFAKSAIFKGGKVDNAIGRGPAANKEQTVSFTAHFDTRP